MLLRTFEGLPVGQDMTEFPRLSQTESPQTQALSQILKMLQAFEFQAHYEPCKKILETSGLR